MTGVAPRTETPIHRQVFWTTLHALQQLGGSGSRQEVAAKAAELGGYTEEQQAERMPNGRTPKIALPHQLEPDPAEAHWPRR